MLIDQPLPAGAIITSRRIVEKQQVAPVVLRITRRTDHQIAVVPLELSIGRQNVDVGRVHQ
jgi:hypothetical protein